MLSTLGSVLNITKMKMAIIKKVDESKRDAERKAAAELGSMAVSKEEVKEMVPVIGRSSVLGFITMDDAWVIAFCDAHDLKYDMPLRAQYALPGAEAVHWT